MQIAVLVKWVPAPQGTPQLGPDHLLVREGAEGALDPGDEFGVEAALQIVEREGGEVTVVSMGPDDAVAAVQRALAMGAHRGVLVTDPGLRGADALATARVLTAALGRAPFDLVIASVESTDGYTGTLPVTVAELLDLPSITFARAMDVLEGSVRAERQTATGYDVVTCDLPLLVTLTAGANEPRFPSLKGVMAARSKPLDRLTLADLGLDPEAVRPTQTVVEVTAAPPVAAGEVIEADDASASRIADLLAEAGVLG
jgi:electron transfer flavoprotein beta subunit